jgi:hypothetical protein
MERSKTLVTLVLLVCSISFISCEDTDDGKFVEPITLYEKINGNWTLTNISQIDETANSLGISPKEIGLFSLFGFETFSINLNVDEKNQPTSYQVNGTAPELFPNNGYWDLKSPFQVTTGVLPTINLYSDAAKTTLTAQLSVTVLPNTSPDMELKLTRSADGIPFVSYVYKLTVLNQSN